MAFRAAALIWIGAGACLVSEPQESPQPPSPSGTDRETWAAWPMPNPPSTGLPNPQDYDTNAPGVVLDKVTGLLWQRAVDPDGLLWPAARARCLGLSLGGRDDWRVPTAIEMISLVDFTHTTPAIDPTAFPDTPGGPYWTSVPFGGSSSESWYIAFTTGFSYHGHNDLLSIRVRCVAGGDNANAGGKWGERYTFPSDDVAFDPRTGLTWQRIIGAAMSWDDAEYACQSPALPGVGWRLPSVKELQTIVDVRRSQPAIDPTAFPATPPDHYWTSSVSADAPTDAWYVSFWLGLTGTAARDSVNWFRCVR